MQIVVRKLQKEDIPALARIEAETFSMPWSERAFRELLERPIALISWRWPRDGWWEGQGAPICAAK